MLISFSHRFIFVSNLKTASTAIESALSPYSQIVIMNSELGKHDDLSNIISRYEVIFSRVPRRQFHVIGVMRDPVDYFLSLYRSHKKPAFFGTTLDSSIFTSEEFYSDWIPRFPDQWRPQWTRFLDTDGEFDLDFLIDFADLNSIWLPLLHELRIPPVALNVVNPSPIDPNEAPMPSDLVARIRAERAEDIRLLKTRAWRSPGVSRV
jgi:hypothetical protein